MAKTRIMVVEDEAITARDIGDSLKSLGYEVSAMAASARAAVERVKEDAPDLILMDIVLKGDMDGIEAAGIIHSKHDIPIVYLTSHASKKLIDRAKKTGPYGYIIKPFEDGDLHAAIEIALHKKKAERELSKDLDETQRLNRLMVGRELRMEELSRENGRLKERVKDLEGSSG